ncbi:WG repeat-containing protein [uncultured Kordia sp.]|uniref:WG repeat-containing protein n=1 Tax=uncultured Kordia sp. TaxID=507699 RepID=UPI002616F324|nr:WG repeat-containing protein [uncultured Kordia sp.]
MRYFKLFLLLFLVNFSVLGQNSERTLFPFNFYDSWGFINVKGEIVVSPIYEEAFNFHDGLAKVRLDGYFGFIDTSGELVIPNQFDSASDFHYGIAIAYKGNHSFYINKKGKELFGGYLMLYDFKEDGYATIFTRGGEFLLVNKKGEIIKKGINFVNEDFFDKKTYVYLDEYGNVKEKYESNFKGIEYDQIQEFGDYLVYSYRDRYEKSYQTKYGVANFKKGFVTDTWFDGINPKTLTDNLIQLKNNGKICYINQQGKIATIDTKTLELNRFLASGKTSTDAILQKFNISHIREASYEVGSIGNIPVSRSHGGWLPSKNVFKKITSMYNFKPNTLDIVVDTERNEIFEEVYEGYKFYITNNTKDSIFFEAYQSKLDLVVQAKYCKDDCDGSNCDGDLESDWEGDWEGHWEAIEYLQKDLESDIKAGTIHLIDNHALHQLYLIPKTYWELSIPKYHGIIKTKLRLKLIYKTQRTGKETIMYSNEFEGNVNPAQYWYYKLYDHTMKPDLGD